MALDISLKAKLLIKIHDKRPMPEDKTEMFFSDLTPYICVKMLEIGRWVGV